ncbi:dolichyl-phosphate-mannose-protein mannosyltransferase PMT2 [Sugiyamaella lignohabitans]|uniref:Dolichyl-phosphate-mannose--protein mannosyltransferase n=1 Tax=Sugiyamaella lignohabitans TaxID=796027 RepID=A0A161HNR4_9ASCO|nr:dolichyl-phosphate-mannose-protein mannosyltransferase PMT2 [Sugiyamaella lignohabitans]ANB15837.1 dolichyl-phosphate-mannose-protein mannosyltransferase PMT2 [Sugiyamaella lignohabitans]
MAAARSSGVRQPEVRRRGKDQTESSSDADKLADIINDVNDKKKKAQKPADGSLITDLAKLESIVAPIIFTALALFTRIYGIGKSHSVTWDEAHFGKFGSYYLKREYYFDVHPPLGKMLVGLSGYLAGYNGSFGFDSGADYPEYVNFTKMRIFNSLFNVGCVPLAYFTAKQFKLSIPAVWLITLMMLTELSYITLGKFILLDSMLAFFTVSTVYSFSKFHNLQSKSFSTQWWTWLFVTGLSIGCVCSVKMVGLFVTSVIGIYTVADLWIKFGDLDMPVKTYALHWVARVVNLIVVPVLVFMASFKAHFVILNHSGPGDSNMSSLFQANLIGSDIVGGPVDLAFGSKFTLKNQGLNGGLLHSHVQTYPEGSEQQQVTTYHHKDYNNEWVLEHGRFDEFYDPQKPLEFLTDGDVIRLMHPATGRNLHSHSVQSSVTKSKWEVSCYGNLTVGDTKDNWIVEIVENIGSRENKTRVHPLSTTIRLKHQDLGCYLSGEGNNLPPWGFRQGEVTCNPKASYRDKKTWWNIESHWNDRMESDSNRVLPKTSFLRDFIQLNFAMMASNNALVPDPDKQDDLASRAWEWPTLHVGLRLCGWGPENVKYFLLGHPSTTIFTTIGIVAFISLSLVYIIRWQRQYQDFTPKQLEHYAIAGVIPLLGWFLHYLPFIVMARVTYVHHYLPALYFAVLTFGFLVDHITTRFSHWTVRNGIFGVLYVITIGIFIYFSPIAFGMKGDSANFNYLNWLSTWRI